MDKFYALLRELRIRSDMRMKEMERFTKIMSEHMEMASSKEVYDTLLSVARAYLS